MPEGHQYPFPSDDDEKEPATIGILGRLFAALFVAVIAIVLWSAHTP